MKEQIRVAGIIVQNHKLLLVKGADKYKEYWTPGGKPETKESELQALRRELTEEIGVKVTSAKYFKEYSAKSPYEKDVITISRVYIVTISGEIKVAQEIKADVWMTKQEFDDEKYPLIAITQQKIIPDLIKAGYF